MVSINDERFKNKVVVVQILGSWCLTALMKPCTGSLPEIKVRSRNIGLTWTYKRFCKIKGGGQNFINRLQVEYPVLIVRSRRIRSLLKKPATTGTYTAFPLPFSWTGKEKFKPYTPASADQLQAGDYKKQKEEYLQIIRAFSGISVQRLRK